MYNCTHLLSGGADTNLIHSPLSYFINEQDSKPLYMGSIGSLTELTTLTLLQCSAVRQSKALICSTVSVRLGI